MSNTAPNCAECNGDGGTGETYGPTDGSSETDYDWTPCPACTPAAGGFSNEPPFPTGSDPLRTRTDVPMNFRAAGW